MSETTDKKPWHYDTIRDMHGREIREGDTVRVHHYRTPYGDGYRWTWMTKTVTKRQVGPDKIHRWYFVHAAPLTTTERDGWWPQYSHKWDGDRLTNCEIVRRAKKETTNA